MIFEYGTKDNKINITKIVFNKCIKNNIILIPSGDINRKIKFGIDPCPGIVKSIFIDNKEYDDSQKIIINNNNNNNNNNITIIKKYNDNIFLEKLNNIHNELIFNGNLKTELPEQLLSIQFINSDSKVLEIGSNIGRNTCIISKLLKNSKNLTTIETIKKSINILKENKDKNNLKFKIIEGALSKQPLIQKGWRCEVKKNNVVPKGYCNVKIFDYKSIVDNYDTLVIDCEGAFYYILLDFPEILNNIKLIIIENDFIDINHKKYVDNILNKHGLISIYYIPGGQGPCQNKFFEVFKKI